MAEQRTLKIDVSKEEASLIQTRRDVENKRVFTETSKKIIETETETLTNCINETVLKLKLDCLSGLSQRNDIADKDLIKMIDELFGSGTLTSELEDLIDGHKPLALFLKKVGDKKRRIKNDEEAIKSAERQAKETRDYNKSQERSRRTGHSSGCSCNDCWGDMTK